MKRKAVKVGIALLGVIGVLAFINCEQAADPLSSDASLSSLRVAQVEVTSLGTPHEDWEQVVPGQVLLTKDQLVDALVEAAPANGGAAIYFDKRKVGDAPINFSQKNQFTFEHEDLVYVELFSQNHDKFLIYAVQVLKKTPLLTGVSLDGVPAKSLGTPNTDITQVVAGEIYFDETKTDSYIGIAATTELENTAFRVGTTAENFDSALYIKPVSNGSFYLESKSGEEHGDTLYYQFVMKAGTAPTAIAAKTITIGGVPVTFGASSVSITTNNYAAATGLATFNRSILNSNVDVVVDVPAGLTVRYGWSKANNTEPPEWKTTGSLGVVHSGAYVVLEVTTRELGTVFYKFRVMAADANTTATLNTVTINSVSPSTIPITGNAQWNQGSVPNVELPALGQITIGATANDYASVRYGTSTDSGTAPTNWQVSGQFSNVVAGTYIGVEVTSENGTTVRYYRFFVRRTGDSGDATLASVTIKDAVVGAREFSIPGPTWNATLANKPVVVTGLPSQITMNAIPSNAQATVEYGYSNSATSAPVWRSVGAFVNGNLGDYLGVRVTSQDKTVNIYRFRLVPGANSASTISQIKITKGGQSVVANVGTPPDWSSAGVWGSPISWYTGSGPSVRYIDTPDIDLGGMLPGDITVEALDVPTGATVQYGTATVKTTTGNDRPPLQASGAFQAVANGRFLCVEVTSQDMSSVTTYGFHLKNGSGTGVSFDNVVIDGNSGAPGTPGMYTSGNTGNPWAVWAAALQSVDVAVSGLPKDLTVSVAGLSSGAQVFYGSSTANNQQPNNWNTHGQFTNISVGNFIGVQVVAQNADIAYYRFRITSGAGTATTIDGITINSTTVNAGTSGNTWTAAVPQTIPASVPGLPGTITVAAINPAAGALVSYGTSPSATGMPNWNPGGTFSGVTYGDYIGVRVISPVGGTVYYRFRVATGTRTTAALNLITFSSVSGTPGTPAATYQAATPQDVTLLSAANFNPLRISAVAEAGGTVRYGTSAAADTAPSNWNTTGQFSNVAPGSYIGVEVSSEDYSTVQIYKFRVVLP